MGILSGFGAGGKDREVETFRFCSELGLTGPPWLGAAADRHYAFIPNSEVEENARPGGRGRHPRRQPFGRATVRAGSGRFSASEVFREGAENGARGGRAPGSGAEFGLSRVGNHFAGVAGAKAARTLREDRLRPRQKWMPLAFQLATKMLPSWVPEKP